MGNMVLCVYQYLVTVANRDGYAIKTSNLNVHGKLNVRPQIFCQ